jgi:hypothetical protein
MLSSNTQSKIKSFYRDDAQLRLTNKADSLSETKCDMLLGNRQVAFKQSVWELIKRDEHIIPVSRNH